MEKEIVHMFVYRRELLALLSLPIPVEKGTRLIMTQEEGALSATVVWNEDGFSADLTETIEGEASQAIITISGPYSEDDDGFDLSARDNRQEASDPTDPKSAANALRGMSIGMQVWSAR